LRHRYCAVAWARAVVWSLLVTALVIPRAAVAQSAPSLDSRLGVAEGFRDPSVMADLQAGWERIVLPWDQIQPNGPGDFSNLGYTLSDAQLQAELNRGEHIVGLFEFTPGWAQADPNAGRRSPPSNLDLPVDDPNNYWARFVAETAARYAGKIDDWVIWNEPEFQPSDPGAGGSYTWLGSDAQFAQLLKVGYLAIKHANPNAHVSFPGTSYWVDDQSNRPQFYDHVLSILAQDPNAADNNFYHDVVSLNLYRAPDDIYRVFTLFKNIQHQHGLDKPVWLTETNAMPSDDSALSCPHADAAIQTTMDEQANYALQAFAMAAAAGYQRYEFYQMVDQNPCTQPAVWGLTRDDGSRRPVSTALKTAIGAFSGYTTVHFVPFVREAQDWPAWPDDPSSLTPNWEVYQVAFDKPGNQRVTALWNGDGSDLKVRIPKNGTSAQLIDKSGNVTPLEADQGWWLVTLPAATAYFKVNDQIKDPEGYHFIGGDPLLIVENGVDPSTAVIAPRLGDPSTAVSEFRLTVSPDGGQTVNRGDPADFFAQTFSEEGFSAPISFSVVQWSTQRFPDAKDGSTLPLATTFPSSVKPGDTAQLHFETAGADPGIYYIKVEADAGGISKTFDLALALN